MAKSQARVALSLRLPLQLVRNPMRSAQKDVRIHILGCLRPKGGCSAGRVLRLSIFSGTSGATKIVMRAFIKKNLSSEFRRLCSQRASAASRVFTPQAPRGLSLLGQTMKMWYTSLVACVMHIVEPRDVPFATHQMLVSNTLAVIVRETDVCLQEQACPICLETFRVGEHVRRPHVFEPEARSWGVANGRGSIAYVLAGSSSGESLLRVDRYSGSPKSGPDSASQPRMDE